MQNLRLKKNYILKVKTKSNTKIQERLHVLEANAFLNKCVLIAPLKRS